MRPVSDAFLRTLVGSHRMVARARICVDFQTGVAPTGYDVAIVDGDVRADASADVRTSVDLATPGIDDSYQGTWPVRPDGLLAPYGNEVFVERGIDYGNGTIEYVSLGYFRINSTVQDDGPNGVIRLTGSDRMAGIVDARLLEPIQFESGSSIEEIFSRLVLEVYPDATIEYDFFAGSAFFVTSHVADEDRYGFLRDVAQARGKIMYWDYRGVLRVESPPDPTTAVYTITSGRGGNLVRLSRSLSRQGVYNAVVARGDTVDGASDPVNAVVVDDNVSSPTFWGGRFGRVPRFFYSSFLHNYSQALAAARSILQQAIGLPYSISLDVVPNPALEPYDPIEIIMPDSTDVHVIDSITIPLTHDRIMTGSTRKLIVLDAVELTP